MVTENTLLCTDPEESCFLCDATVDVKFEPCDHAVMCSGCAQRAKKCPKCRVSKMNTPQFIPSCLLKVSWESYRIKFVLYNRGRPQFQGICPSFRVFVLVSLIFNYLHDITATS